MSKRQFGDNDDKLANEPPSKRRKQSKSNNPNNEHKQSDPQPTKDDKIDEFNEECMKNRVSGAAKSPLMYKFDETRICSGKDGTHGICNGKNCKHFSNITGVAYWMSRDQRVQDNWSLIYAQKLALEHKVPLFVVFCLLPKFLDATLRQFDFMLNGLAEVENECRALNIPFCLLLGHCTKVLPKWADKNNINVVVTDFTPLKHAKGWYEEIDRIFVKNNIHFSQVDAHNIVPLWITSNKQEYAARTIRNKINSKLDRYLTEFPPIIKHIYNSSQSGNENESKEKEKENDNNGENDNSNNNNYSNSSKNKSKNKNKNTNKTKSKSNNNNNNESDWLSKHRRIDWEAARKTLEIDITVKPVDWARGGTQNGYSILLKFIKLRLKNYATLRNDPNAEHVSDLSPWLHFGQISAQRVALTVSNVNSGKSVAINESIKSFLEELIIRRELSDNYCYYNNNYDNINGAYEWAYNTIILHKNDKREYDYSLKEFEECKTHELLWNAAQKQMVVSGKMHGFLRMYWAKKIFEWSKTPEKAIKIAIYLNDKYNIDGRDPNGYVGIMWSICGIHDQGWREREIFGKIRYMNLKGCKRKFDVAKFVKKWKV